MTLKYGRGNQTWYELVDPKQGYNYAKFEKPPFNSVPPPPQVNVKAFWQIKNHVNYFP